MMDFYLRTKTETEFNELGLSLGLLIELETEDGTMIVPVDYAVLVDRIGPFSKATGVDENGDPVLTEYNDYHVNIRLLFEPTQELIDRLAPYSVLPEVPYRVFA